jgi:hypothetical protein
MMIMSIQVVSIGHFENGSFGVFGLPIGGAELFRVDCPELREAVAKQSPALCSEYGRFTFASRSAADAAAKQQAVREAKIAADRKAAKDKADKDAADAQQSRVDRVLAMVLAVGEEWAAGRVAVKASRDGSVIVGRWDAQNIPGHGRPVEVMAAARVDGKITLVPTRESYGMLWF